MKLFTRAVAGILGGIVVVLGIISVLGNTVLAGTPLMDALGADATNALLDASGVKGDIDGALRDNADAIARATGMSESQVMAVIDELDISSWSATSLPADAEATGSFETSYRGAAATLTTYADPSYVTVDTYGQRVTLAVPASAQDYLSYLAYL